RRAHPPRARARGERRSPPPQRRAGGVTEACLLPPASFSVAPAVFDPAHLVRRGLRVAGARRRARARDRCALARLQARALHLAARRDVEAAEAVLAIGRRQARREVIAEA